MSKKITTLRTAPEVQADLESLAGDRAKLEQALTEIEQKFVESESADLATAYSSAQLRLKAADYRKTALEAELAAIQRDSLLNGYRELLTRQNTQAAESESLQQRIGELRNQATLLERQFGRLQQDISFTSAQLAKTKVDLQKEHGFVEEDFVHV